MSRSVSPGGIARYLVCLLLLCAIAVPAAAQSSASIAIDPDCGPEGSADEAPYEIVVQGSGYEAGDDVEIYFAGERQDNPDQEDVVADESGSFGTVIHPARRSAGSYAVEALQRHGEGSVSSRAIASFVVPCPESTTTTEPSQGSSPTTTTQIGPGPSPSPSPTKKPGDKPDKNGPRKFKPHLSFGSAVGTLGSVAEARGRGFPPRTKLVLRWSEGAGSVRVLTDGKGRFEVGALVFPNDVLGPRRLVVEGRRFRPVRIRFLVVPSTASPPDFVNR
ncbi:MAG: hypothetical protein QOH26_1316 [Actinomycetota bacterium]|nr:hypothetical protein [Actinomycetota bacterium]